MTNDKNLQRDDFWQTQERGTNDQEFQIFKQCAEDLGWPEITFEEWMAR